MRFQSLAGVAELADAPDSKSGESNLMWVRVPPPVLSKKRCFWINPEAAFFMPSCLQQYYSKPFLMLDEANAKTPVFCKLLPVAQPLKPRILKGLHHSKHSSEHG